jgi:hypothetical protein
MLLRQYIDQNFEGNVSEFTRIAFPSGSPKHQQVHTWLKADISLLDGKLCTVRRTLAEGMPVRGLGKSSDLKNRIVNNMVKHVESRHTTINPRQARAIVKMIKADIDHIYGT